MPILWYKSMEIKKNQEWLSLQTFGKRNYLHIESVYIVYNLALWPGNKQLQIQLGDIYVGAIYGMVWW